MPNDAMTAALEEMYRQVQTLREQNRVPALDRCLEAVAMNLHWALWLRGAEPEWLPGAPKPMPWIEDL
jgi:hypothetical protein